MKNLGIRICIIGSIIAILYVPFQFLGMNVGWHFIFGDSGLGMQFINFGLLLLELILINGIGVVLIYFGKSKK
jgi:hypothetical protein